MTPLGQVLGEAGSRLAGTENGDLNQKARNEVVDVLAAGRGRNRATDRTSEDVVEEQKEHHWVVQTSDHLKVLASCQIVVDCRELTCQTDARARVRRISDHVDTRHLNPTGIGSKTGRQQTDEGRLACTVWA